MHKVRAYCHPKNYEGLPNALYHNNGDGTFTDMSRASGIAEYIGKGMGVNFADYDHDGRMDVLVTNDTLPNFLFHNEGDGWFREVGLLAGIAYTGDGKAVSSMGADFRDVAKHGVPAPTFALIDSSDYFFSSFKTLLTLTEGIARASSQRPG